MKYLLHVLPFVVVSSALCVAANAQGTLVVVDPTISGDTVSLPIHLQGAVSDGVAALDFQFQFDASVLQPNAVQSGEAAAQAGKDVRAELLEEGVYSVLMFGGDLTGVAQGEIARISLTKIAEPASGESLVTIANTTFATVSGVEIESLGSSTTLLFDSDDESGDAGSLPPSSGSGSPLDDTPEQLDGSATGVIEGDAKESSTEPSGAEPSNNLVNAGAGADARVANLQNARAEREAARAELNERSNIAQRGGNGIRVRRESSPDVAPTSGAVDSPRNREDSPTRMERTAPDVPSRHAKPVAQADVDVELEADAGSERESEGPAPLVGAAEDENARGTAPTRRLWIQAAFLGLCIAAAAGIYAIRRRR